MRYDIIGDTHGHADKLVALLKLLGYDNLRGFYRHEDPERKAIFVGDFIDRGPKIRETLRIVKSMCDRDAALAVMGNHEYNAICFHTKKKERENNWLRPRSDKNIYQHLETLIQFKNYEEEWKEYMDWFRTLPVFMEIDDFRVVHAAWIEEDVAKIKQWTEGQIRLGGDLIRRTAVRDSVEYKAIENLLKGVEIRLPEGRVFDDKDGIERKNIRVRWWQPAENRSYREMIFPGNCSGGGYEIIDRREAGKYSAYADDKPVFFGHYWLSHNRPTVQKDNICCLDYSVAKGGKLVAYRWNGEDRLDPDRLVWV